MLKKLELLSADLNAASLRVYFLLLGSLFAVTVAILAAMGRVWICSCGYIKWWEGDVWSSHNSQHISDWYTFSHLIHGFIFYGVLAKFFPKWPLGLRMLVAMIVEVIWEVVENSPMTIDRYRQSTISLNYYGDSILNASFDIMACLAGFWLARWLPVKVSIVAVILMELIVGYIIRDNLTLNVIMLLYPIQAIKDWQTP